MAGCAKADAGVRPLPAITCERSPAVSQVPAARSYDVNRPDATFPNARGTNRRALHRRSSSSTPAVLDSEQTRSCRELRELDFRPLTRERWADFEKLFGPRGACGGCWCMWWRLKRSAFEARKGLRNKQAMKRIVQRGEEPGLLAYHRGVPVAWCSVGPREVFPVLERSRILGRVDDKPVWSVVCFFVAKGYRKQGMTARLLKAAAEYARKHGATILEGYPVEPKKGRTADVFVYTGLASVFRRAGFEEVARRSETRPVMRLSLRRTTGSRRASSTSGRQKRL